MINSSVAGVILAAGKSERFGANKLVADVGGKPMLRWVVEAALRSGLSDIAIIVGHQRDKVLAVLEGLVEQERVSVIDNDLYSDGQSASVVAGVQHFEKTHAAVMFLMGDQPYLESGMIDDLIDAFDASSKNIAFPVFEGQRKTPVIFGRNYFHALMGITGDIGGRNIIKANPDDVLGVPFAEGHAFLDFDRPSDLAR